MSRVMICGGGTGGHVTPGLAVARELRELGIEVAWLGVRGGIEERLVPAADLDLHTVDFDAPRGGLTGYLRSVIKLWPAAGAAGRIIRAAGARVALGLGGYPSLPGMCASRWQGLRCLLHEQNVSPGIANRVLAPWMHRVLTSHPRTFASRSPEVIGNPVRREFTGIDSAEERAAGRNSRLRLLVIGGSQGARSLNEGVPAALEAAESEWEVVHSTGRGNLDATRAAYERSGVDSELVEFMDDVPQQLADADLVVCRAGASSVAEIACVGVAAVLVPYPHARLHQLANARPLAEADAAHVLADEQVAAAKPLAEMLDRLADRGGLAAMGEKARARARPQAARDVAKACAEELENAA